MKKANKVERYGPPHFNKDGFVSIWFAIAPLSRIPDSYFEERYGDEEVPLTKFYGDFGFGYFDHDFMDTNASEGRAALIEKLVGECSHSLSFAKQVAAATRKRGLTKTQFVVLLFDFQYDPKKTMIRKSSYMEFLGSFPYDRKASSAMPYQEK